MAIVNRDLDPSQQQVVLGAQVSNTATGATYCLGIVPFPAQFMAAQQVAVGLSGAPNHSIWIQRFVVGAGVTSINIGASLVSQVFGTSGAQAFTAPGSATFLLQAGDALLLATAAANTGAAQVNVTMVLKALQDIRTHFGS